MITSRLYSFFLTCPQPVDHLILLSRLSHLFGIKGNALAWFDSYRSDQKLLAVPKSRLKTYGDRAFSFAAPKVWNKLPFDLRSLDTINLFKKHKDRSF